eukprot:scaffold20531_cov81-Phaeocystis_antarctica.AAC.2
MAVHMRCTWQCTCGAHAVHMRCTCGAHAVHMRCTCGAHACSARAAAHAGSAVRSPQAAPHACSAFERRKHTTYGYSLYHIGLQACSALEPT